MKVFHALVKSFLQRRLRRIELGKVNAATDQKYLFEYLVRQGRKTAFGREHGFRAIHRLAEYQQQVPIQKYEEFFPYIQRALDGERNVIWPGIVKWFAKSSGTTNAKSKFIPITSDNLHSCHFAAGRDMFAIYLGLRPNTVIMEGKCLTLGGSHQISQYNNKSRYGDLSSVLIQNLPSFYQVNRSPSKQTALMADYELKLQQMTVECPQDAISCIAGVPTWTLILLEKILQHSGRDTIKEVWPLLSVYFHGGVNFAPYRLQFEQLFGAKSVDFIDIYNASEGFLGIQDRLNDPGMLLLTHHGVYYEFVPLSELQSAKPIVHTLADVELDTNYALVISTNSGLWRYVIGDTVRFIEKKPFRFLISGRTNSFINAFGEELMVENADFALAKAAEATGAVINDYTAAPIYLEMGKTGGHEWFIEFKVEPSNLQQFTEVLDKSLQDVNSDYQAKRKGNMALGLPIIHQLQAGTFYHWMKNRKKLGGQHKVPRLHNDRSHVESLIHLLQTEIN
jgi:hypothetical protein